MIYGRKAYSELGSKIKKHRKELGMTQASLSEGVVTRNMLSRIENGDASPSLDTLVALAERLNVSVGYLLDDRDDGSSVKNERLLALIKKEFDDCNYSLALQYLDNLEGFHDEKCAYTARCRYAIGIKYCFGEYPIKDAQRYISDALKLSEHLDPKTVNEGKIYRAMLDSFSYEHQSGREDRFILPLVLSAEFTCDISLLASALSVLKNKGGDYAEIYVQNSIFENVGYRYIIEGLICASKGDNAQAKAALIKAMSIDMPSVIRCFILTELEKCCAELKDFENAYCYMNMRKELVEKLTKK